MLYLIAIVLPPAAVLLCGKVSAAFLNAIVMLMLGLMLGSMPGTVALVPLLVVISWIPGILHAILVVNSRHADARTDRVVREVRAQATAATAVAVATSEPEHVIKTGRQAMIL